MANNPIPPLAARAVALALLLGHGAGALAAAALAAAAPAAGTAAATPVAASAPAATPATAPAAVDASDPGKLIDSAAREMLAELDAHRAEYRKDPARIEALVSRVLLPHFDTEYAARMVLARHWTTATPEQRKRFVDAFYHSLLGNYGGALVDFTGDRLKVLPFTGDPASANATIRTQVRKGDGGIVAVIYSLRKTPQGWKAWDVIIEGISYVKSFRDDFGSEIEQKGLDSLIARLEQKAGIGK
jgi:phospholipid transport system substrate-binding protein